MTHLLAQADAGRLPLADKSVDLVIGSPPYLDARLYLENGKDLGIARRCSEWVEWMLSITAEALRVSRGLVLWVVAGKTEDWCYQPAPEGLTWEWWKRGGECHLFRPCYWHRYGISGSGGEQWYRADVEYVLAFKRPGKLPYGNPTANGHTPKYAPGGEMAHRLANGARVNQWGPVGGKRSGATGRKANGSRSKPGRPSHVVRVVGEHESEYDATALANPGTLLSTGATGGGNLGHEIAHENEAPYPEAVPKFFINSHCPPGGIVLDPFSGSGTTVSSAEQLGRIGIGFDLRLSQCRLGKQRTERPHAPVIKASRVDDRPMPLFA